jgi:shikimate dehydrogenase
MCDDLSETAKALGAVNLIKFQGNKVLGDNTDGDGFIKSILTKLPNISFQNNSFTILGAGGAAKSIAHALKKIMQKKLL